MEPRVSGASQRQGAGSFLAERARALESSVPREGIGRIQGDLAALGGQNTVSRDGMNDNVPGGSRVQGGSGGIQGVPWVMCRVPFRVPSM